MDNLIQLDIEGNPLKQIPYNLKYANLSQMKQYLETRITKEDKENMPYNLKIIYNKKLSNKNNNNVINQNNQVNINYIFNYIKNNSE